MSEPYVFSEESYTDKDARTYKVGDVHVIENNRHAFDSCLLLGFTKADKWGDVYVKLARPYAYVSCAGTTCPTVLQGCKVFETTVTKLRYEVKIGDGYVR